MPNRTAYLQTMISLASAAFGVVAALAWNSAITVLVKQIFGTGGQIVSLPIYTIIITAQLPEAGTRYPNTFLT